MREELYVFEQRCPAPTMDLLLAMPGLRPVSLTFSTEIPLQHDLSVSSHLTPDAGTAAGSLSRLSLITVAAGLGIKWA